MVVPEYADISVRALRAKAMVAQGQSPAIHKRLTKQGAAPDTTVAEFGERFIREMVSNYRQDLTIPRRYFDKSIVPANGTKPVRNVTTEDVRTIIWRRMDEIDWSGRTETPTRNDDTARRRQALDSS